MSVKRGARCLVVACLSTAFLGLLAAAPVPVEEPKPRKTLQVGATVLAVAFSPDGKMLASGTHGSRTVKLWDVETGKNTVTLLKPEPAEVRSLAYSPDGKFLATAGWQKDIHVWDVEGEKIAGTLGAAKLTSTIAFSADGKTLASGDDDKTIRLWDVEKFKLRATLEDVGTNCIAFSSDGTTLASIGDRNSVILWNTKTLKRTTTLQGHKERGYAVAFSGDGKVLASGGADKTIKLWDVATGNNIATLEGHTETVHCVAFTRDGKIWPGSKPGNRCREVSAAAKARTP